MRPHPDSVSTPAHGFTQLGIPIANGPFDQALQSADAVILDYLHTSVLRDVLLSGKPVMTFEFGHCPPNQTAQDSLSRRIRFIPGQYDETNRADTDWSALPGAIDDACAMAHDTSFTTLFEA
jgi:hypothetical protein